MIGAVNGEEALECGASCLRALLKDGLRDDAGHARGEADHAFAVLGEQLIIGARFAAIESFDPRAADDANDVLIALLALGEEDEMRRRHLSLLAPIAIDDGDL